MLKVKAPSKGNCSKCEGYQKQITRLQKAFIKVDDENVRRCMKYEDKILKFKTEKEWLEADQSSEKSKQEAGVRGG